MRYYLYFTAILFFTGCASDPGAKMRADDEARNKTMTHGWGCGTPSGGPCAPAPTPTFIDDDYPRALAEAKARHVPLFVDAWASWCHSCVSLKNFVFTDPRIAQETSQFVWLAIDTENPKNGDFVAKFPNAVLPTLRVIDPKTEEALLTWQGTLTAQELVETLEEARGAAKKNEASNARSEDASVMGLSLHGEYEACARVATNLIGKLPNGTQRVDVAVTGTDCATQLPKDQQQKYLPPLLDELKKITHDMSLPILADDRSGAYEALVDAGQATGEKTAARENAVAWAAFLEAEAAKAKTPAERAVFDPHRLLAYLALNQPERAIPMLEQTAKDFPDDFNPPARMARAYLEMGKVDDAITSSDRALSLANGPRKVKIALLKVEALAKKNDVAGERQTLTLAIAFVDTLPPAEASPKLKSALADRLAKLDASSAPPKKLPAKK
ncbi:MAG: thioredoxin family protein [Polyangiaceae bacterium]